MPDRRYLVADGDRRHHDLADSGRDCDQAWLGDAAFFGIVPEVVTRAGEPVPLGQGGLLVVRTPWPSMARTVWGDAERYQQTYFSDVPGSYFTGDGARWDSDGYYWLMGRVDDVINVSGHRLGTMEIESALVAHPKVAEAAVVGRPDDMKGQAIVPS